MCVDQWDRECLTERDFERQREGGRELWIRGFDRLCNTAITCVRTR